MAHLLDVDQLRTFVAIAETGSFTRAGDVVHKTQSAVSMQMKRLEERIGRPVFARDGRGSKLTEDGERLLVYARRIVRLNQEAANAFSGPSLAGLVRLGVPDDYADRYLPEIMARFSRSYPSVELTVMCEPTPELLQRIAHGELDLAIITNTEGRYPVETFRRERLLWVGSMRHMIHETDPLPLALGSPNCTWRRIALDRIEQTGRRHRVLYSSWNSAAVAAAVLAGLAISVLPESALRSGMRVLGRADGLPALPTVDIGLVRTPHERSALADTLAEHIVSSLDNMSETGTLAAE